MEKKKTTSKKNNTVAAKKEKVVKKSAPKSKVVNKNTTATKVANKLEKNIKLEENKKVEVVKEEKEKLVSDVKKEKKLSCKNTEMIRMIGVGVALIVLVGLTFVVGLTNKKDKYIYQTHVGIKETTVSEYLDIISKNDISIIYVGRPGCGYCQMFNPILEEVLNKYKIGVEYVNIEAISSEEEWNSFEKSNEYLAAGEWGTPTLIIMKNNKIVNVNPGYVEKDTLVKFFVDNGIIKGE